MEKLEDEDEIQRDRYQYLFYLIAYCGIPPTRYNEASPQRNELTNHHPISRHDYGT